VLRKEIRLLTIRDAALCVIGALTITACTDEKPTTVQPSPQIQEERRATTDVGAIAPPTQSASSASSNADALPNFKMLVKNQGQAVVNIVATRSTPKSEIAQNDEFYEFFRRFIPDLPAPGGSAPRQQGLGSGFIIRADGYILTNAHVIAGADEVKVRLADSKREYTAKVIGSDPRTDVAVLKVDATGLPTLVAGDSSKLEVGEWVAAIGSPFGFDNTITAGIVSAKGRSFPSESFVPFIQTDVAVNPGNSGGPLLNLRGEVVGINSMIYTQTGGYMGVSFAIPIEVAMDVSDQLRATGKVRRGKLGVQIQSLTADLASSFKLPDSNGVLVSAVERGGPADKAGIQAGDVIRQYDGKTIEQAAELPRLVAGTKPGDSVRMEVWRQGATKQLQVTVGELPGEAAGAGSAPDAKPARGALGLAVRELSPQEQSAAGIKFGVLVESAASPASEAGIQPGDVITAVGPTQLSSLSQFRQLVSGLKPGDVVPLLVRRGEASRYVSVRLAKN
jgi:serine protease Do